MRVSAGYFITYAGLLIGHGKKVKFRGIFRGKFAGKSANLTRFSREKVKIRGKIGWFRGILAEKSQISKDF